MSPVIRKAVFPVAGLGTRFLPATKANPKEMLPVVDKPLIQYAVEEAVAAGITQLIFVTNIAKRAIEDHFDRNFELEFHLTQRAKQALLETVQSIRPDNVHCVYIRQPEPRGLGDAVLCAKDLIGSEPFAVLLADDLIDNQPQGCLAQMLDIYARYPGHVVAVEQVPIAMSQYYGIVAASRLATSQAVYQINDLVEKPLPQVAPSDLAIAGRYILQPQIFDALAACQAGAGGEIQLTDAIGACIKYSDVYAYQFTGQRYDCGSKLGYLKATIAYGLKHPEIGGDLAAYMASL